MQFTIIVKPFNLGHTIQECGWVSLYTPFF